MKQYTRKPKDQNGGIWADKRWRTWFWRRTVHGKRKLTRIGTFDEFPTKAKAERYAWEHIVPSLTGEIPRQATFGGVALRYMETDMPQHKVTADSYRNILENYCIPKWGDMELEEVANPPVKIKNWIESLDRAPKSKSHIKNVMRQVFQYAMREGTYPLSMTNPLTTFRIKDGSKRQKAPRTLSVEEFNAFIDHVPEAYRPMIYTALILGLRREEVWALKWSDVDFINDTVSIERTIIGGIVYERAKTESSEADLPLNATLKRILLEWRSKSEFNGDDDWLWASPWTGGEMPLYLNAVQRDYIIPASLKVGLGKLGWHAFRHTFRDWLSEGETELDIQRKLMRHSNVSMTAKYGSKKVSKAMRQANERIGELLTRETTTVN